MSIDDTTGGDPEFRVRVTTTRCVDGVGYTMVTCDARNVTRGEFYVVDVRRAPFKPTVPVWQRPPSRNYESF